MAVYVKCQNGDDLLRSSTVFIWWHDFDLRILFTFYEYHFNLDDMDYVWDLYLRLYTYLYDFQKGGNWQLRCKELYKRRPVQFLFNIRWNGDVKFW